MERESDFPDFNDISDSRSPSPNVLCIDETVCDDDDEDESATVGCNHPPETTIRVDDTLNTTMLDIPSLSNLASPSETQLTETQHNASVVPISSGGYNSEDADRFFVRKFRDEPGLNDSVLLLSNTKVTDTFESKLVVNQEENGATTAPVSDNDEPASLETFYTAQDTTPVAENDILESKDTVMKIENPDFDEKNLVRAQCSFHLQVDCLVTFSKENGCVIEKQVEKVQVANRSARGMYSLLDKRASLSSSGSVYSDKSGLPFPLPPRVSIASAITSSTSTNEDAPPVPEAMLRIPMAQPWKNDCLLTLACDEALQKNVNLGPAKITPVNRVSLASESLLEKGVNAIDLNPMVVVTDGGKVPLEPTPKRPRGRPKGSKITEEGSSPQVVKSTPKRIYRRKNSTAPSTSTKSSIELTSSEASLFEESPGVPGSRKRGRKADNLSAVAASPRKKRVVQTKPETPSKIRPSEVRTPVKESQTGDSLPENSPTVAGSGKRGRKPNNGVGVAGPSGLTSSAKKRVTSTKEEKPAAKKFKKNECALWNTVPGLDVDETNVRSSNKFRGESIAEDTSGKLGPIPTEPVFTNMKFLLCYVRLKHSKKTPKQKSSSNSDFSESEDHGLYDRYERIPFNETYLRKQINAGGGTVFNNFDELPDEDMNSVYLVTNRPNCSAKFLLSFLSKVTILHHLHIIEACRSGFMRSMRLQHVGWSKAYRKWMEAPRNVHMTLSGKSVHLLSQSLDKQPDKAFKQFWTLILEKLGARIVTDLNCEYADIIVTNRPPPKEMEESVKAIGDMAPTIASIEWLKECIIQGCPVSQTLHNSFHFNDDSDSSF